MSTYESLEKLIEIGSPTGYTDRACDFIFAQLASYGLGPERTRKGAVKCALGKDPRLAVAAHVDTLGAMVTNIRDDGNLRVSLLGGLSLNMAEGEYVTVHTMGGDQYTGTFLLDDPSVHANKNVATAKRETKNMHVRLDEEVGNADATRELGIRSGDIICFDPRYQELPSGFIKSRFLDNKAGCYVLFDVARRVTESGQQLPVELFFSNYEEVGHGGTCGYAPTIEELLVIDMGVLGKACEGREDRCSICAKDTSGPYDWNMRSRLVALAEAKNIPHVVDVYPFYGSDGSAALRAGNDFRVGLIGPGVAASHGVERTHVRAIQATIDLTLAYAEDFAARA